MSQEILNALSELPEDSIRSIVMEFHSSGQSLSVESIKQWATTNIN